MPLSNCPVAKKRKTADLKSKSKSGSGKKNGSDGKGLPEIDDGYEPLSLKDIQIRVLKLCERVPRVPERGIDPDNLEEIEVFATKLQICIEDFNLLVVCVSTATYQWGGERSGAADQNLTLLSGEISNSQEHLANTVTPRLANVLAPVVNLVTEKTVVVKENNGESDTNTNGNGNGNGNSSSSSGEREIRENIFKREKEDPYFWKLTRQILARNAPMLRQVVLASFHKTVTCIGDYLQAQSKDSQHDSRSLY
mmetsp:Transcript_11718/g.16743  ORF Transcript_11718/g.16743 Transcript_11718/m.16743 type:complete len:252 (+) Transcript_11718:68-823(+)